MGFYGEIINTGESPFVFDKIYSSRYHMERSMASDGIYAGRFVLVSYDSSYTHNDFKRAYIKEADKGANKTNINLYKDADCTQLVKYKDFEEEIESAGEELAATLTEVYYVKDGYYYTYYKCSGNNNGIASFDYYNDMNTLLNQAYRRSSDSNLEATVVLYKDAECTEALEKRTIDSTSGVAIGDVVFVEEVASEQSEKEQVQGLFSYYECVAESQETPGVVLFTRLNTTTGHFQDETLENYIFNQKLDATYFGNEGGVHNYDKTVWQKVYIGEKEKYIKVASLNSDFPKINLTVDPPATTIVHAPYFDSDINGTIEDLHLQQQWGLRVGAANKALSTKGSWRNPVSGNYVNYEEGLKNVLTQHVNNILSARQLREQEALKTFVQQNEDTGQNEIVTGNAYASLVINLTEALDGVTWSSLENIVNIRSDINTYISLEQDNTFKEKYDYYNTPDNSLGFQVEGDPDYSFGEIVLQDRYPNDYTGFTTIATEENGQDLENESLEEGEESNSEIEESNSEIETINPLLEDIKNIFSANNVDVDSLSDANYAEILNIFDEYFSSLAATNGIYDLNLYVYFWTAYGQARDILQTIFSLDIENPEKEEIYDPTILQEIIMYPQSCDRYEKVPIENISVYEPNVYYIFDEDNGYILYNAENLDPEETYYRYIGDDVSAIVESNYNQIKDLIEESGEIKSDTDITWTAKSPSGEVYSFDGETWTTDSVTLPADIYYNKAGFDYKTASKDDDIEDEISITPTGISQVYDEANEIWVNREFCDTDSMYADQTVEYPDTNEISIHLPSIGNTISTVWDLVYGEGDPKNENKRRTNIAWDRTTQERTRLIHDSGYGKYTHSKEEMATIAGAINTTQDLMGRIIVENAGNVTSVDEIDEEEHLILDSDYIENNLNPDTIYYFTEDEQYYKVVNGFNFDDIDQNDIINNQNEYESLVQGYSPVNLMDPNHLSSAYYYLDTVTNTYTYNRKYLKNRSYWTITESVMDFQVDSFYIIDDDNLTLFNSPTYQNGTYYDFKTTGANADILTDKYLFIPGEFYTYDDTTHRFSPAQRFIPVETYYLPYTTNVLSVDEQTHEVIYGSVKFVQVYTPFEEVDQIGTILVSDEALLDLEWFEEHPSYNKDAYIFNCFIKATDANKVPSYLGEHVSYYDSVEKTVTNENAIYLYINGMPVQDFTYNVKPTVANGMVAQDGSPLVEQSGDNIICGILKTKFESDDYLTEGSYQPDVYYYKENSGYNNISNYVLETNPEYDREKTYFALTITRVYPKVYEKGVYYISVIDPNTNTTNYLLSTGDYSSNVDYYEHNKYYVTQNYRSHTIGEIWDYTVPWEELQLDAMGNSRYSEVTTIANNNPRAAGLYEQTEDGFILTEDTSIKKYYRPVFLDSNTYESNVYYTAHRDYYTVSSGAFDNRETYYSLENIYKPVLLTENSYSPDTYYILVDGEYELSDVAYDADTNYYKYIGQDYVEIILTSQDYEPNVYYTYIPSGYSLSSEPYNANEHYYEQINKKYYDGHPLAENYANVILNCHLVSEKDLENKYELQPLEGFGRQYNTINGLILKMNSLIGDANSYDRNLSTVYGTIRKLNDEINRLSLYKTTTINDIVVAINACYEESIAIADQLKDLRGQALGAYGGLLTEDEAIHYYPSLADFQTVLGYQFNNETDRTKTDALYTSFNEEVSMNTGNNVGDYQRYAQINGIEYYRRIQSIDATDPQNIQYTYYQDYTTSNTLDPVYGGIKTIAPLNNIPALFSNSSSTTNRSLVNEIDHKVNIEGYYADIGKTPAGMRMNPEEPIDENVAETAVEAPPSGTILYRLQELEKATADVEEVLYGNGLADSTFDLSGYWLIDDIPIGYTTLEKSVNFTCNNNPNLNYTKIIITNESVQYLSDTDTTTVFKNNTWTSPDFQKIKISNVEGADYSAVKNDDNLYNWLLNKAKFCGRFVENDERSNDLIWTPLATGLPANEGSGTTVFKAGSEAMELLKTYNSKGLLARLTALDTDLNLIPLSADYSEALKTALADLKSNVQLELTGQSSTESGVAASKGLNVLEVDGRYGFSLLQAKTSVYKYNPITGETTYDYNIRVSFKPSAALSTFNTAFLQVEGMQLFEGAQKLNIINDVDTSPNLDAEIGIDGKIYFRSNGTWPAATGATAYTFLLNGHLVEIVKDQEVSKEKVIFAVPTGDVQKRCSFKTAVTGYFTKTNPAFTIPPNPTLANCTFTGWKSEDGTVTIQTSDLGGGRDLTKEHPKWKDIFDENGIKKISNLTFYPTFEFSGKKRLFVINGKDYWIDPTTKVSSFFASNKKIFTIFSYLCRTTTTGKGKKKTTTKYYKDVLALRSIIKSEKRTVKSGKKTKKVSVNYIKANQKAFWIGGERKSGSAVKYKDKTMQWLAGKSIDSKDKFKTNLEYYKIGAPSKKITTKKTDIHIIV